MNHEQLLLANMASTNGEPVIYLHRKRVKVNVCHGGKWETGQRNVYLQTMISSYNCSADINAVDTLQYESLLPINSCKRVFQ